MLNTQLTLQSGPRLDEFNRMKNELTVMWRNFNDKVCTYVVYVYDVRRSVLHSTNITLTISQAHCNH